MSGVSPGGGVLGGEGEGLAGVLTSIEINETGNLMPQSAAPSWGGRRLFRNEARPFSHVGGGRVRG